MLIYILTDGDYSDYHIIGVYSTEEMADKAKQVYGGDIETYEADEYVKDSRYPFHVRFDGENTQVWSKYSLHSNKLNDVREYNFISHPDYLYSVYVLAEDKEHAIKIASDLVAQYKASK